VATTTKTPKPVAPTVKQRAVLDALTAGRVVKITESNGKKSVTLTTPAGNPVKNGPKLDRTAVEACQTKGWVDSAGKVTDDGRKAKRIKVETK